MCFRHFEVALRKIPYFYNFALLCIAFANSKFVVGQNLVIFRLVVFLIHFFCIEQQFSMFTEQIRRKNNFGDFTFSARLAQMINTPYVSLPIRNYSMDVKITWIIVLNFGLRVFEGHMRNCQMPTVSGNTFVYRMEEITSTLWYIYWNDPLLQIEPSGWKGSVTYGLGADISLPPCLATGIWNLAPKATSGPKSRGASFGTTLWRHVQRYCAHFSFDMQIILPWEEQGS